MKEPKTMIDQTIPARPTPVTETWEPQKWEFESEATKQKLTVTEATALDCFEFERKVAAMSSDAAADWIISKYVETADGDSINLVLAAELGLSFPDKVGLLQIIKMQDGLFVEPLDGRDPLTTKIFKVNNPDLIDGVRFECEDPPFNHRASDYSDIPSALADLAQNNIQIQWIKYGLEPTIMGNAKLDKLPYFVGDVGIRHYSQLLSRIPKKKKLQKL